MRVDQLVSLVAYRVELCRLALGCPRNSLMRPATAFKLCRVWHGHVPCKFIAAKVAWVRTKAWAEKPPHVREQEDPGLKYDTLMR